MSIDNKGKSDFSAAKNENIHAGHRQKVKQRFYAGGFDGMAPHNVLELLLFFGIPRKDTNPIAHELISKFGTLSGVFEAKRSDLMNVKGMTESAACLITMMLPLYKKYTEDIISRRKLSAGDDAIIDYLRALYLDNSNVEQVYALCFDNNKALLACRQISQGDISSSPLDMRNLAAAVLETNATYVALSHNHPHGIAAPSQGDVNATIRAYEFLKNLKINLFDHIIITDDNHISMSKMYQFAHIFYGLDIDDDE